ncbi:hypothetical protein TRIUR3_26163 [Triticum urartu]|uniref:Uncharacterized protein n=1 Tax=Triticum urartu TaxID=4572 RepID=M7YWF7_TRIUA|nr:hypothetical protein TRIUR3_26163 [Triticum urartu]
MAAADPIWMMLDRFVFRRDPAESSIEDRSYSFSASHIAGSTPFTVAFRVLSPREPPRLYLKWPPLLDPMNGSSCDLVAAHDNLLLISLTSSPGTVNTYKSPVYPQEHFICRASTSPSQPSLMLHKIPMCTEPLVVRGNKDKVITTQRSFHPHTVGILCRGDEEFAVAQLSLSRPNLVAGMQADLCVLRSSVHNCDHKWEVEQQLPIQCKFSESSDLIYWKTDTVIPFKTALYWVDFCSGGMLFCDVFQERPAISYLQLPICNRNPGYEVRPFHDMHRSVCITKGGQELNFIDVVREDGKHVGPMSPDTGFTINRYALMTSSCGTLTWKKFVVKSSELDSLETSPSQALTFPLVSMDNPNMVHFLLSKKMADGIDNVSVVTVDMKAKEMVSSHPYIKGNEDLLGKDADMVRRKSHLLQPFISSRLPKFFNRSSCFHLAYHVPHLDRLN